MSSKYFIFDLNKFRYDVKNAHERSADILPLGKRLFELGLGQNVFSNARQTVERRVDVSMYEDGILYGAIKPLYMRVVCEYYSLNMDDYKAKEKVKKLNAVTAAELLSEDEYCQSDIIVKIDELISAINALGRTFGRIQAQNMEYLKDIKDGIDKLNDKWK